MAWRGYGTGTPITPDDVRWNAPSFGRVTRGGIDHAYLAGDMYGPYAGAGDYGGSYTAGGWTGAGFGGGYYGYFRESPPGSGGYGVWSSSPWSGAQDGFVNATPARGVWEGTSYAGRGPRNYRRSDTRIAEDVIDALTDDPDVDASDIEVEVRDREVTLTGFVDDRRQKRRADDDALGVPGVEDVHNRIRVRRRDRE